MIDRSITRIFPFALSLPADKHLLSRLTFSISRLQARKMMFANSFSMICLVTALSQTYANPVVVTTNSSDPFDPASSNITTIRLLCAQDSVDNQNTSLFQILNDDRIWFIDTRSTFVYGTETWKNGLVRTTATGNETIDFVLVGENSNSTCVTSEVGQITSHADPDHVDIQWPSERGSMKLIFMDGHRIHLTICHALESNQSTECAENQTEHLILKSDQQELDNDTITWLQSHCSIIDPNDFIINDDPKKCLSNVTDPATLKLIAAGPTVEEEKIPEVTTAIADLSTRSNRTNRLEVLEEYYSTVTENATTPTQTPSVNTTVIVSVIEPTIEEVNGTNTIVTVSTEAPINEKVDSEKPFLVLHQAVLNEVTNDHSETATISPAPPIESTEAPAKSDERSSTDPTVFTESPTVKEETSTVSSTTESIIPVDCPTLKDCPFDSCTFARKTDHRGCPTCHCLPPLNKSNFSCPILTCQACLYGHFTDVDGCPICQCQTRPYPPLGERCPQLNCDPCYFGTVKDEYNCDSCICIRPNSQECPALNCTFGLCNYGSALDEDDCPTCECLLPSNNATEVNCTSPLTCPSCHLGYMKDANGCQTCQCKSRGTVSCASLSSTCHCPFGSYLNSVGCETCSCLPDPKNAPPQACWELSDAAKSHNHSSGPSCAPDGAFSARQCDQSKCWCVTPTGIPISGFESQPEENVNCGCAVELYQVSSLRMIGHHLLCLMNGNFGPIQCDGRYCSCVDENGKPIGPSVSIQNREQLRCVGVYQQLHPERYLLHRGTIEHPDFAPVPQDLSSSLCLTHLEQIRHANITDDHILIPVCDENGLYSSVQCDQSERYCWCVDKKTGVEMEGTRRLNARPNCQLIE